MILFVLGEKIEPMITGEAAVFIFIYISLIFCFILVSRFKLVFLTMKISTLNKVINK